MFFGLLLIPIPSKITTHTVIIYSFELTLFVTGDVATYAYTRIDSINMAPGGSYFREQSLNNDAGRVFTPFHSDLIDSVVILYDQTKIDCYKRVVEENH